MNTFKDYEVAHLVRAPGLAIQVLSVLVSNPAAFYWLLCLIDTGVFQPAYIDCEQTSAVIAASPIRCPLSCAWARQLTIFAILTNIFEPTLFSSYELECTFV